jgi:hypothetical protein
MEIIMWYEARWFENGEWNRKCFDKLHDAVVFLREASAKDNTYDGFVVKVERVYP